MEQTKEEIEQVEVCDECGGSLEKQEGEFDNLTTKKCICKLVEQKENQANNDEE